MSKLYILIKNRVEAQTADLINKGFYSSVRAVRMKTAQKAIGDKLVLLTDDESSSTGYRAVAVATVTSLKEINQGDETRYNLMVTNGVKANDEIKWTPGPETTRLTPWNGKEAPVRNRKTKRSPAEYKKAAIAIRIKKAIALNPMKATLIIEEVAKKAAKIGGNPTQAAIIAWGDYLKK